MKHFFEHENPTHSSLRSARTPNGFLVTAKNVTQVDKMVKRNNIDFFAWLLRGVELLVTTPSYEATMD